MRKIAALTILLLLLAAPALADQLEIEDKSRCANPPNCGPNEQFTHEDFNEIKRVVNTKQDDISDGDGGIAVTGKVASGSLEVTGDAEITGSVSMRSVDRIIYASNFTAGSLTGGLQEAYDWGVAKGWTNGMTIIGAPGQHTIHKAARFAYPYTLIANDTTLKMGDQTCVTVAEDAIVGATTITLSDASSIVAGYEYAVWDATGLGLYRVNHIIADSIDGNIVTFHRVGTASSGLAYAITAADSAVLSHIHNAINTTTEVNGKYVISGLTIDGNYATCDGAAYNALYFNSNEATWIQNVVSISAPNDEVSYLVENCRLENIAGTAMNMHGSGGIARGNFIRNVGSHGIDVGDDSPTIDGNHIENCGFSGIYFCLNIWQAHVVNNEIEGCQAGIWGIGSGDNNRVPTDTDEYHIIANNHIVNTVGHAIRFANYPRGVNVLGNIIRNANTALGDLAAVHVYRGRDIIISGNQIIDTQAASTTFEGAGISVSSAGNYPNIIIANNVFENWVGTVAEDVGITAIGPLVMQTNSLYGTFKRSVNLTGSTKTLVSGNHFTLAGASTGIHIADAAANLSILNNIITIGSGGIGINYVATSGAVGIDISHNKLFGAAGGSRALVMRPAYTPAELIFIGNSASGFTQDYDLEGTYPAAYRPNIGGADFKADIEMFNFGVVTID